MIKFFSIFVCGLVFAFGLGLSGMVLPEKVLGFLDPLGHWDPSLAFVMGGALLVNLPLFAWTKKRRKPMLAEGFHFPGGGHQAALQRAGV